MKLRNSLPVACMFGLALIIVVPDVAAQCSTHDPRSIATTCDPCQGGNPTQQPLCNGGGYARERLTCRSDAWKSDLSAEEDMTLSGKAACGNAPANTAPVCFPSYFGPNAAGTSGGNLVFRVTVSHQKWLDGGCAPDSEDSGQQSIPMRGCCDAFCDDPTGCSAAGRVWAASGCFCNPGGQCESVCQSPAPCDVELEYNPDCQCCIIPGSPIIFDLAKNQIEFSHPADGALFDILATGRPQLLSWPTNPSSFWLALDRNRNGTIDDGSELFGNSTKLANGRKAQHGYEALSEFDANGDRQIDARDPIFTSLRLWQRRPAKTGEPQPSDVLLSLSAAEVRVIFLDVAESRRRDEWGNEFRYRSRVDILNDSRWSYDVFLMSADRYQRGTQSVVPNNKK